MKINFFIIMFGFIFSLVFILLGRFVVVKLPYVKNTRLILYKGNKEIVKLGGITILASLILGLFLINQLFYNKLLSSIILGSFLIFILGIFDDLRELKVWQKFLGQLVIILFFMLFSGLKTEIAFLPKYLNFIITLMWILGITNSFNLLDIQDGLATGVSFIISLAFILMAHITGNPLVGILALLLSGPLLAILIFNFPPAKIYLGDSGSLFLGFVFSIFTISISFAKVGHELALLSPFFILGFPICDTLFVSLTRISRNKPIFMKTDDHFGIRLTNLGVKKTKVLFICYFLTLLFITMGILFTRLTNIHSLFLIFITVFFLIVSLIKLNRIRA